MAAFNVLTLKWVKIFEQLSELFRAVKDRNPEKVLFLTSQHLHLVIAIF